MKIAFPIIKADSGSDVYYRILAGALARHGVSADIIELGYAHEFLPGLASRCRRQLKHYDIVQTNVEYAALFRCPGVPLVATLHHNVLEPRYQQSTSPAQKLYHRGLLARRIARSLRCSDASVCVSHATADSFRTSFGDFAFRVILNGIDLSRFAEDPAGTRDPRRLIMVGKLSRRKGGDYVQPLMEELGPDFTLDCVTRSEGAAHFGDNVRILSGLDDRQLVAAMKSAGFVLSLSRIEGFGYAVAEGMACGCAVAAWDNSALPELCTRDRSGRLVEEGDLVSLASAIRSLAADAGEMERISRYNRQRIQSGFGDERMVGEYLSLYRELLGG